MFCYSIQTLVGLMFGAMCVTVIQVRSSGVEASDFMVIYAVQEIRLSELNKKLEALVKEKALQGCLLKKLAEEKRTLKQELDNSAEVNGKRRKIKK